MQGTIPDEHKSSTQMSNSVVKLSKIVVPGDLETFFGTMPIRCINLQGNASFPTCAPATNRSTSFKNCATRPVNELKNKKTFKSRQFGDIGGDIRWQVAPVIPHPVHDALMIDVKYSANLAHGPTFEVQLQCLEPDFFLISLLFGHGGIPAATRSTPVALAAGRRPSVTRLLRVFVTSRTEGAKWGHRD